jgi:HEAT repeat protein
MTQGGVTTRLVVTVAIAAAGTASALVCGTALAGAPKAPPLAALNADLDGDKAGDRAVIQADGTLEATDGQGASLGHLRLTPAPDPKGTVELAAHTVEGQAIVEVVAHSPSRPAANVLLAQVRDGKLQEVYAGFLGPLGDGSASEQQLDLGATGVTVFQTNPGIARCDGTAGQLFFQRLDLTSGELTPAVPDVPGTAGATTLQAAPAGATRPLPIFRFDSASAESGADTVDDLLPPRMLDDGNASYSWLVDAPGGGRGQFVTARDGLKGVTLTGVIVMTPPPGPSPQRRVRSLLLSFDTGSPIVIDGLDVGARAVQVRFPTPVASSCLTATILDSSGPDGAPVAIGELEVMTNLDGSGGSAGGSSSGPPGANAAGLAQLVALVGAGGTDGAAASAALERVGAPAADALAAALPSLNGPGRSRVIALLASLRAPSTAPALVQALRAAGASDADQTLIANALRAMPAQAVGPLAGLIGDQDAPADARVASATLLGGLDDPGAIQPLLDAAGSGGASLRHAVRTALAQRRPAAAAATAIVNALAAASSTDSERIADLCASLPALAVADPTVREPIVRALVSHAVDADADFEVRARAVVGLGLALASAANADDPATTQAATTLGQLVSEKVTPDPILRRLAAQALGSLPAVAATQPLTNAAQADSDPGVRDLALAALENDDSTAVTTALIAAGTTDGWVFVRRDAATDLAVRCQPDRQDGLLRIANDPDETVAVAALSGLVGCDDDRGEDRLLAIATNRALSVPAREQAADLLAQRPHPDAVSQLAQGLSDARADSIGGDEELVRIAGALARALGRTGSRNALDPLTEALTDEALAPVQVSAAIAIGDLCPALDDDGRKDAADALAEVVGDGGPLASTAQAALEDCKR